MNSKIMHRMTRRLNDWGYSQRAIYSIVVTLSDRSRPWLGVLAKNGEPQNHAKNGEPRNCAKNSAQERWHIEPSTYGQAVLEALDEMPRHYPQVSILERQLMPEHFHFVVFVKAALPKPLGALIRGFKAGAAKKWKLLANDGLSRNVTSDGPRAARSVPGHCCPAWSDGFQDTILFREGQLPSMIAYIRDNPRRLAERIAHPDLFRRIAHISIPLDGGRLIGQFEALGNRHLVERPLFQVQCSRRFFAYKRVPKPGGGMKPIREAALSSPEYTARRDAAFAAAKHGTAIISPCISDGEREIAREALEAHLPLVVLRNKGFSSLEKPHGMLFDACAEGHLLMLAPAAWPYSTQEKPMTRSDATALNRIAQWLCGEDALDIDYKGMKPLDIDRCAQKAVCAPSLATSRFQSP